MHRFAALCLFVSSAFASTLAPASAAPAIGGGNAPIETHGELPAAWVAEAPPSTPDDLMCANWADGWKVEPSGADGISLSRAGRARTPVSV
jgi:hypothetical protein